ncbi:MAG: hypothetical protein ABS79_01215 [Planctomycetes bacterium SCN 63-9]|nr:MAG: hypothetical protein ABS79_01215 [Planctomycetes bacterium SCN 63-9]
MGCRLEEGLVAEAAAGDWRFAYRIDGPLLDCVAGVGKAALPSVRAATTRGLDERWPAYTHWWLEDDEDLPDECRRLQLHIRDSMRVMIGRPSGRKGRGDAW